MKKIALLILSVMILCTSCIAQAAEKDLPVFTSIRDVLDSTESYAIIQSHEDYIVLILEMDNRYIRMFVMLDDHANELYQAAEAERYSPAAIKAFEEYAWSLPLSYIGELTETPKSQAELDRLKGKTVQELMDKGFGKEMLLPKDELKAPVSINLEYGFYKYEFEVTNAASGYPHLMKVKSGKFSGFSRSAFTYNCLEKLYRLQ